VLRPIYPQGVRRTLTALVLAAGLAGCGSSQSTSAAASSSSPTTTAHAAAHTRPSRTSPRALGGHAPRTVSAAGRLTLITEPADGIAPVLSAVEGARHQVEMVMYEDTDRQFDAVLADDEHRGVVVRVLLDGGYHGEGASQNQTAYNYLKRQGVPVRWTASYFALTHQKTVIVDGRAYILTFNLTPQYYASSRDFGIVDTLRADEQAIEWTFGADWNAQQITAPDGADLVWSPGSQSTQVKLIESATGWLDVYNEEMDSPAIESALEADAHRGVNVRVTMTADPSWDSAFAALTAAGVHVRTYAADAALYIHAKMILTPARALLGSQNFSDTSMNENRELGLIVSDAAIRASLSRTFNTDYAHAAPYGSGGSSTAGGSTGAPGCSASASYSDRYGDWDVYVHSGQPGQTVTVTDRSGRQATWHTDTSGYADVYFKAPADASGETVTVRVGSATCHTTL
jgi:phosphatidylserine/phosphatidylglycerophosphate/cardiolipin synthase-like enzyme